MLIGYRIQLLLTMLLSWTAVAHAAGEFDHEHSRWAAVLQAHVTVDGPRSSVDYAALKANPRQLDAYLRELSAVTPREFNTFSRDEQLAFWMNAYNAFTLKLIIDHYPIASIRRIGGLLRSPWKIRFFTLLGEERHLDEIEHEIIRPQFKEPRIHFTLVCAAKGCPPLIAEPYVASRLEEQFEAATRSFLRDTGRNRFDSSAETLFLSSIFRWYREDFEVDGVTLQSYVAPYLAEDEAMQARIREASRVRFLNYDWTLNDTQQ
jgi:hypothetical protein